MATTTTLLLSIRWCSYFIQSLTASVPVLYLLSSLKSIRLQLAKKRRVPAYIIFPDATLHQMILHKPQTLEEMGQLNGVGPQKLEKYGQAFLEVVKGFD